MLEDRFEQSHGGVLSRVSEVLQVILETLSIVVLDANVNDLDHEFLEEGIVATIAPIRKRTS